MPAGGVGTNKPLSDQSTTPEAEVPSSPARDVDGRMAKPIFVVGAAGSGTTLLRLIVDSHPNIAIGPETAIMRLVRAQRWVPFHEHGDRWWKRLGATDEELQREVRDFYARMFEHAARRQGKNRWGDKTPLHVWHIDEIARTFDDAVVVAIVRHPAASIASNVSRFRFSVKLAIGLWLRMNRALVYHGAELGDRLGLIRYEDLVADPEAVLRELLDWLEEPWSPAVLEHDRVQREKGAPESTDGRTRPGDAIDRRRASKWMTVLTERERNFVRARTRDWATFFGYDVDRPEPVEPFVPAGSPRSYLMTAKELDARRTAFAGRVDFSCPKPALRDQLFRELPSQFAEPASPPRSKVDSMKDRLPAPVRATLGRVRRRLRGPLTPLIPRRGT
jgi:hypothetical protein